MPAQGPEPILPAHDLSRTRAFYESLGFKAGYHDDRYEILRRGNLVVHLEPRDDLVPETNPHELLLARAGRRCVVPGIRVARAAVGRRTLPYGTFR